MGQFKNWMRETVQSDDVPESLSDTESFCLSDYSFSDSNGNTCQWYDKNVESCSKFDTDEFISSELCCSCDGRYATVTESEDPTSEELVET